MGGHAHQERRALRARLGTSAVSRNMALDSAHGKALRWRLPRRSLPGDLGKVSGSGQPSGARRRQDAM